MLQRAAETGTVQKSEIAWVNPSGKTLYLDYVVVPELDSKGEVASLLALGRDVTERKASEQALQRMNRELRAISNCNQALMRVEDEGTLLTAICRIVCEEAGYSLAFVAYAEQGEPLTVSPVAWGGLEARFLGQAGFTWMGTDLEHSTIGTALRTGKSACIHDFATQPGPAPWRDEAFLANYSSCLSLPLKDEGGKPFGVLAILAPEPGAFTDDEVRLLEELAGDLAFGIVVLRARAERQAADAVLQERDIFIHNVLESVDEGFRVFGTDCRILSSNPAYGRITGTDPKGSLGLTCQDVFHLPQGVCPADGNSPCLVMEVLRTRQAQSKAMTRTMPNGEKRQFEVRAFPVLGIDGSLASVIETLQDVTEKRSLEEQLRQVQKMEAIGTLAGGVAHDFNNLLTAIMGYSTLIKMRATPGDPILHHVDAILGVTERGAHLTQSLLAFSRKQVMDPKPMDLNQLVRRIEGILRRIIGEDILLATSLLPGELMVRADPGQIEQVLMNLVANSRDAMPRGGRIQIATACTEAPEQRLRLGGGEAAVPCARMVVSDSGHGMDETLRSKIFEPFFTTKELGKGTGLGLAIVYGILKQHGGDISVTSEVGTGTTFEILLPLLPRDIRSDWIAEASGDLDLPRGGSEVVLMAEDDPTIRSLMAGVLADFGYHVLQAGDGKEALALFREHSQDIDLLLTDVIIPNCTGVELTRQVRLARPGLPVIMISGYAPEILERHGRLEPKVHFLRKPIDPFSVLRTLREVLDRQEP